MLRPFLASVPLVLLTALDASAQGAFVPQGEHWMEWNGATRTCQPKPADLEQWARNLQRLATVRSKTPGATGPKLYGQMQGTLDSCKGRLRGALLYWPWPVEDLVFKAVPGKPGQTRPTPKGETSSLKIAVNRLQGLEPVEQLNDPGGKGAPLGVKKPVTRLIAGYPVLGDSVLLITAPGREPFKPVSLGQALEAWVAHAHGDEPARLRMKAKLASLSAEARSAPGYLFRDPATAKEDLVAEAGPNAQAPFAYNPGYFDDALPHAVPQVLAVEVGLIDLVASRDDPRLRRKLARHMLEAPDWQALARELMH